MAQFNPNVYSLPCGSQDLDTLRENCKLIYFDLETSGFDKTGDILQIAAKCGNHNFSVYVNPTQPINIFASEVTGLQNIDGELFLHGEKVDSIPLRDALRLFHQYLLSVSQQCLLVAHNVKFDSSFLLRAIINNSMVHDFKDIIAGFSDTCIILKKKFPGRKGPGMFKLSVLAQDLLRIDTNENLHNAIYDVYLLEKIVNFARISKEDLFASRRLYMESLFHEMKLQNAAAVTPSLAVLKGIISDEMIRRIAYNGISYDTLRMIHNENREEGIILVLSEKLSNNKPRVTGNKNILKKITTFLDANS